MSAMATVDTDDFLDDDFEDLEPSLQNIVDQKSLKWIFVGGKGGVGKTSTSCSLGVLLSASREKVLIASTDPAHNLSDAFGQKFSREPVQVNGYSNLFCMEIDTNIPADQLMATGGSATGLPPGVGNDEAQAGMQSMFKELTSAVPGVDEAMSFAELMKQVQVMDYDVIVFDTAPTGHTLRLLSLPQSLEKALGKIVELKSRFGGLIGQMSSMFGGQMPSQDALMSKLESTREVIQKVSEQFRDPTRTTFVCVCIPEFLSVYETERLVQELSKFGIDVHNIVVNQVLIPPHDWEPKRSNWGDMKCCARQGMQNKYLDQIFDLYEDFNIVTLPLLDAEVRGVDKLRAFSQHLVTPFVPGSCADYKSAAQAQS
eukprot:g521.t1